MQKSPRKSNKIKNNQIKNRTRAGVEATETILLMIYTPPRKSSVDDSYIYRKQKKNNLTWGGIFDWIAK